MRCDALFIFIASSFDLRVSDYCFAPFGGENLNVCAVNFGCRFHLVATTANCGALIGSNLGALAGI